jgi:hypothetical protein
VFWTSAVLTAASGAVFGCPRGRAHSLTPAYNFVSRAFAAIAQIKSAWWESIETTVAGLSHGLVGRDRAGSAGRNGGHPSRSHRSRPSCAKVAITTVTCHASVAHRGYVLLTLLRLRQEMKMARSCHTSDGPGPLVDTSAPIHRTRCASLPNRDRAFSIAPPEMSSSVRRW